MANWTDLVTIKHASTGNAFVLLALLLDIYETPETCLFTAKECLNEHV